MSNLIIYSLSAVSFAVAVYAAKKAGHNFVGTICSRFLVLAIVSTICQIPVLHAHYLTQFVPLCMAAFLCGELIMYYLRYTELIAKEAEN